jgi:IS605 OrfB family transposase
MAKTKTSNRTTIPGILYNLSSDLIKELDTFMFDYGFMFRYAFKRYVEIEGFSLQTKDIQVRIQALEKELSGRTNYPIRVAKDAVADAIQLVKSQHELMKDYLKFWNERYENAKNRYEKLLTIPTIKLHSIKMIGLRNKMEKQLRKIEFYNQHIQNNTFPSVVFGGKSNYEMLVKKEITKERWKELRNGRISSRGDATKGGNPNLRVIETENGFVLQVISNRKIEKGKTFTYEKTIIPLYIATKRNKNTGFFKGRKYPDIMHRVLEKGSAYEVEILKRDGKYYVHIVVKDDIPPIQQNVSGFLGVDTNIDGLALCQARLNGSPVCFEWVGDDGLQYYPSDKRENKIWELCHYVLHECLQNNLALVVEDIGEMNNREMGKWLRRKIHQFCYKKIIECLEILCIRYGVKLIKIKPQYTSVIGRLKYQTRYRVNVHLSAAYVIARRAMGYKEEVPNKFKSLLTTKQAANFNEQDEWKQWSTLKKRITNLLKRRKAKFYQWKNHKKEIYFTLNKPKKKKVITQ